MSYYFGINNNFASSFFSSNFGSNSGGLGLSSMYSSLGDYSSIRTGAYSRLLKHYYAKTTPSDDTTSSTSKTTKKTNVNTDANKTTATKASALKSNADTLEDASFTEENREKVTTYINNFVDSYNNSMNDAKTSTNVSVSQKAKSMMSLSKSYTKVLASAGITVNDDHTLSVNSDTLKNTDMTKLKAVFGGNYSYSSQVSNYASMIYNATSNQAASIYTSNGTVNTLSSSSILDTYV